MYTIDLCNIHIYDYVYYSLYVCMHAEICVCGLLLRICTQQPGFFNIKIELCWLFWLFDIWLLLLNSFETEEESSISVVIIVWTSTYSNVIRDFVFTLFMILKVFSFCVCLPSLLQIFIRRWSLCGLQAYRVFTYVESRSSSTAVHSDPVLYTGALPLFSRSF